MATPAPFQLLLRSLAAAATPPAASRCRNRGRSAAVPFSFFHV